METKFVRLWQVAMRSNDRPTVLALTRQNLPVLEGTDTLVKKGLQKVHMFYLQRKGETPKVF